MSEENIFCNLSDLRNESDVEQFFVIKLLEILGFSSKNIKTKKTIRSRSVGKGKEKKEYRPDYIIHTKDYPKIIIDAKHPQRDVDEGLSDALLYARDLNGEYIGENPIEYCIGTNGKMFKVCKWDENEPILTLNFTDFEFFNPLFNRLRTILSFDILAMSKKIDRVFSFKKPDLNELDGIFKACHNLIWKKEKMKPTEAFYEFSKLFFVKLYCDRIIHQKIHAGKEPSEDDFTFTVKWIESLKSAEKNPMNTILFKNVRDLLEGEIQEKHKKRIFNINEQLNLKPSTIKEVVKLLEHLDLFGIDEDLNGRMFENFLNATVRGKELGQFFTPMSVVKFMTQLADLRINKSGNIDIVLDACCGSGGFLIEAMSHYFKKINSNQSLTNSEKNKLKEKVVANVYGVLMLTKVNMLKSQEWLE